MPPGHTATPLIGGVYVPRCQDHHPDHRRRPRPSTPGPFESPLMGWLTPTPPKPDQGVRSARGCDAMSSGGPRSVTRGETRVCHQCTYEVRFMDRQTNPDHALRSLEPQVDFAAGNRRPEPDDMLKIETSAMGTACGLRVDSGALLTQSLRLSSGS